MPRIKKNSDIDRRFGARLRAARIQAGLTQQELGQKLGLVTIQKYESGALRIPASMLLDAAKATGVDPSFFWEEADEVFDESGVLAPEQGKRMSGDSKELIAAFMNLRKTASRKLALTFLKSLVRTEHASDAEDRDASSVGPEKP